MLTPCYVGPDMIFKRVGEVAYESKFLIELTSVHLMFHVSMHKKCVYDLVSILPLERIGVRQDLSYE